jgi:hypothetical protein
VPEIYGHAAGDGTRGIPINRDHADMVMPSSIAFQRA